MRVRGRESAIGQAGVLTLAGTAALLFAGWMRLIARPEPVGWVPVVGIDLAGGALILVTCRVRMPGRLRAAAVAMLIGMMFLAMARGQVFAIRGVDKELAAAGGPLRDEARFAGGSPDRPADGAPGGRGAAVVLIAGDDGGWAGGGRSGGGQADDGQAWARAIDGRWDGALGGSAASGLRIEGRVTARAHAPTGPAGWRLAIDWSIGRGDVSERCGWSRISGTDRGALVEAVGETMRQAVRRSVALARPSCP